MSENNLVLSVDRLSVHFSTEDGVARAVQDVSLSVKKGKTFYHWQTIVYTELLR